MVFNVAEKVVMEKLRVVCLNKVMKQLLHHVFMFTVATNFVMDTMNSYAKATNSIAKGINSTAKVKNSIANLLIPNFSLIL